jgi:hypothetical protein
MLYKSSTAQAEPQTQRHPKPGNPHWKIPVAEWPAALRRIEENNEPLRQVAKDYAVSYEAVRRVVRAARQQQKTG